jgi:hypothetical protein
MVHTQERNKQSYIISYLFLSKWEEKFGLSRKKYSGDLYLLSTDVYRHLCLADGYIHRSMGIGLWL